VLSIAFGVKYYHWNPKCTIWIRIVLFLRLIFVLRSWNVPRSWLVA